MDNLSRLLYIRDNLSLLLKARDNLTTNCALRENISLLLKTRDNLYRQCFLRVNLSLLLFTKGSLPVHITVVLISLKTGLKIEAVLSRNGLMAAHVDGNGGGGGRPGSGSALSWTSANLRRQYRVVTESQGEWTTGPDGLMFADFAQFGSDTSTIWNANLHSERSELTAAG